MPAPPLFRAPSPKPAIAFNETADRPTTRTNDDEFSAWSPGEAMLADWSHYPFEWMEGDDDTACFAALRALPRADKEKRFAAAVARSVKGQLAFEHDARPELEATVARLDIDFAKHVRGRSRSMRSPDRHRVRLAEDHRQPDERPHTADGQVHQAERRHRGGRDVRLDRVARCAIHGGSNPRRCRAPDPERRADRPAGGELVAQRHGPCD